MKVISLNKRFVAILVLALLAVTILAGTALVGGAAQAAPSSSFDAIAQDIQAYMDEISVSGLTITGDELFARLDKDGNGKLEAGNVDDSRLGPTIIDVRGSGDYQAKHIPGAINVAQADIVTSANLQKIATEVARHSNKDIVLYCTTGHTESIATMALAAVNKDQGLGYNIKALKWGMLGWNGTAAKPSYKCTYGMGSENTSNVTYAYPSAAGSTTIAAADFAAKNTLGGVIPGGGSDINRSCAAEDPAAKIYVDVRETAASFVPDAYHMPLSQMFASVAGEYPYLQKLPMDKQIVVYHNTHHEAEVVATALTMLGYKSTAGKTSGMRFGLPYWNPGEGEQYNPSTDSRTYTVITSSTASGFMYPAPTIDSTSPANGETNVPANVTITVAFSEPVTGTSWTVSDKNGIPVIGTSNAGRFDPVIDLTKGETYTVTIKGAKSVAGGVQIKPYTWSFTVEPCPSGKIALPGGLCTP